MQALKQHIEKRTCQQFSVTKVANNFLDRFSDLSGLLRSNSWEELLANNDLCKYLGSQCSECNLWCVTTRALSRHIADAHGELWNAGDEWFVTRKRSNIICITNPCQFCGQSLGPKTPTKQHRCIVCIQLGFLLARHGDSQGHIRSDPGDVWGIAPSSSGRRRRRTKGKEATERLTIQRQITTPILLTQQACVDRTRIHGQSDHCTRQIGFTPRRPAQSTSAGHIISVVCGYQGQDPWSNVRGEQIMESPSRGRCHSHGHPSKTSSLEVLPQRARSLSARPLRRLRYKQVAPGCNDARKDIERGRALCSSAVEHQKGGARDSGGIYSTPQSCTGHVGADGRGHYASRCNSAFPFIAPSCRRVSRGDDPVLLGDQCQEPGGKQGVSGISPVGGYECVGSPRLTTEEARLEAKPVGNRDPESVGDSNQEVMIVDLSVESGNTMSGRASPVLRRSVPNEFASLFAFRNTGNTCYQNASLVALLSAYVRLGSPQQVCWGLMEQIYSEHQRHAICELRLCPSFAVAMSDWVSLETQQDAAEFVHSLSMHVPVLAELCWESRVMIDDDSVVEWHSPHGMSCQLPFHEGMNTVESMLAAWSGPTASYRAFIHPCEVLWVQISRFVECEAGGVQKVLRHLNLHHRHVQVPFFRGPRGVNRDWVTYRILAVVAHLGPSVRRGHYTTMLWTESADENRSFICIDDHVISSSFSSEHSSYARHSEGAYLVVMARDDALVPLGA